MLQVHAENIGKRFGTRTVFRNIDISLKTGDAIIIAGRNGSGKTTLLKIMAGLVLPSVGKLSYTLDDKNLDRAGVRQRLSYVGPETTLYDSLTASENMIFFAKMRGLPLEQSEIDRTLEEFQLGGRGKDFYGSYSSGMKQRLKYAVALLNDPDILLLDEPSANLDDDGKKIIATIIEGRREKTITIIATNEPEEYGLADAQIRLGS